MKKFFRLFKRGWFIAALILVLIILFTIILGDQLSIAGYMPLGSPMARYGLIVVLVIAYIGFCAWRIYKTKSHKGNEAPDPVSLASTALRKQLYSIARQLKRSVKKSELSKPPCYIMLGTPGSGKTALIEQAGPLLPLATDIVFEETQSFATVHVREKAIIIEIANRFIENFTAPENTLAWKKLLAILRRYNRSLGYTAILMIHPLSQIIAKSSDRQTSLHNLHAAGKSLRQKISLSLVVYLIVTEMDRLSGFSAYFSQLNETERGMPWHMLLSQPEEFTSAYQALIKNLNDQLLTRLHREQNRASISLIAGFPLQMASIKPALEQTVKNLCQPTGYHDPLKLTGVYFTSNHQQGEEINPLMGIFDKPVSVSVPSVSVDSGFSYFSRHLFKELQTQTITLHRQQLYAKRRRQLWLVSLAGILSLSVMLIILGYLSYQANRNAILHIQQLLTPATPVVTQKDRIVWLNALLADSQFFASGYGLQYVGFNQSEVLRARLQAMYVAQLQTLLIASLADIAATEMQSAGASPNKRYHALKIYLMLGDSSHAAIGAIENFTEQHWQAVLPSAPLIKSLLYTDLPTVLQNDWQPITLDQKLIAEVRRQLLQLPLPQLSYIIVRYSDAAADLPRLALDNSSIQNYNALFQTPVSLSGFYTSEGQTNFLAALQKLADIFTKEGWVIDRTLSVPQDRLFMQNLMTLYQDDTLQQWQQLFTHLLPIQASDPAGMSIVLHTVINQSKISIAVLDKLRSQAPEFVLSNGNLEMPGFRMTHTILKQLLAVQDEMQALSRNEDMPAAAYTIAKNLIGDNPDEPIVALYNLANQQTAPLRDWLAAIARQSAMVIYAQSRVYLNTEWRNQVYRQYIKNLYPYYPLNEHAATEITPTDFTTFFGPDGTLDAFIQTYLAPFIVKSGDQWQLKTGQQTNLGLSLATLTALQHVDAAKVAFFHNRQLGVQFNIAPFSLDSRIMTAQLSVGTENIIDRHDPHLLTAITWSPMLQPKRVSLSMTDGQGRRVSISAQGDWAWFRLADHCQYKRESENDFQLNCSVANYKIAYRIETDSKINPFNLDITSLLLPAEL